MYAFASCLLLFLMLATMVDSFANAELAHYSSVGGPAGHVGLHQQDSQ